jgi:hypothetical protein
MEIFLYTEILQIILVAAAKNVTLSGSAPIFIGTNSTYTEVNYLRFAVNTSTYQSGLSVENTNAIVNYCSFTNYPTSTTFGSGNGVLAQGRAAIWVRNSYFTSMDRYIVSVYNGIITADTNSQGTNSNSSIFSIWRNYTSSKHWINRNYNIFN